MAVKLQIKKEGKDKIPILTLSLIERGNKGVTLIATEENGTVWQLLDLNNYLEMHVYYDLHIKGLEGIGKVKIMN